ncbi:MAG: OadG family protein [Planctomycetes bacterium]|nr:OadG family protein [Planctomycetota bacterium]
MADAWLILFLGMGGVFLFLLVLIFVMQALVALLPPNESDARSSSRPALAPPASADQAIIAVLQAAVVAYETDIQRK